MHLEDLAALKEVSENAVIDELRTRHFDGLSYTFIGDVLLYLNPNRDEVLYENKVIRDFITYFIGKLFVTILYIIAELLHELI